MAEAGWKRYGVLFVIKSCFLLVYLYSECVQIVYIQVSGVETTQGHAE